MSTETTTPTIEDYYVEPFPGRKGAERIVEDCGRCLGTGVYTGKSGHRFHTPAVGAVDTGCFYCEGTGKTSRLVSSARATARRMAKDALARELARLAYVTERETFVDRLGDLIDLATEYASRVPAALDAVERYSGLGACREAEEALLAVPAAVKLWEEREAAKRPVPVTDARIEVEGEVVSTRFVEGNFGPGSGQVKMLLACDGFKLWGTLPTVDGGLDVGDRVALTARVEPSRDDPAFGFYKRPSKVRKL